MIIRKFKEVCDFSCKFVVKLWDIIEIEFVCFVMLFYVV